MTWRRTAAQVIEELFPVCKQSHWNDLLDLRQLLLDGRDWTSALEGFRVCRHSLEADHYLPFYRLRKILASHLRLENTAVSLEVLLRKRDFSFRQWESKNRKLAAGTQPASVRLIEQH